MRCYVTDEDSDDCLVTDAHGNVESDQEPDVIFVHRNRRKTPVKNPSAANGDTDTDTGGASDGPTTSGQQGDSIGLNGQQGSGDHVNNGDSASKDGDDSTQAKSEDTTRSDCQLNAAEIWLQKKKEILKTGEQSSASSPHIGNGDASVGNWGEKSAAQRTLFHSQSLDGDQANQPLKKRILNRNRKVSVGKNIRNIPGLESDSSDSSEGEADAEKSSAKPIHLMRHGPHAFQYEIAL